MSEERYQAYEGFYPFGVRNKLSEVQALRNIDESNRAKLKEKDSEIARLKEEVAVSMSVANEYNIKIASLTEENTELRVRATKKLFLDCDILEAEHASMKIEIASLKELVREAYPILFEEGKICANNHYTRKVNDWLKRAKETYE